VANIRRGTTNSAARAAAVRVGQQDDLAIEPLTIATLHVAEEAAEGGLPHLPVALVDVVRDIVRETIEHGFRFAGLNAA